MRFARTTIAPYRHLGDWPTNQIGGCEGRRTEDAGAIELTGASVHQLNLRGRLNLVISILIQDLQSIMQETRGASVNGSFTINPLGQETRDENFERGWLNPSSPLIPNVSTAMEKQTFSSYTDSTAASLPIDRAPDICNPLECKG